MSNANERMQILEMIANGKITADQGNQLLEALNSIPESEQAENLLETVGDAQLPLTDVHPPLADELPHPFETEQVADSPSPTTVQETPALPPGASKWRSFWAIPLWIGVGITVLGGYWMYKAQMSESVGWFICASLPFALGVLAIALAWQSRTAPWLHLRVQQKPGERPQRIAFSFPIPVRPAAWALRTFGHRIKGLQDTGVDEVIMALGTSTNPDNPLYIQVDEGEDGEKVEVYIG